MSSLNKLMYSFLALLFLCSPIPSMASKHMKLHGTHEKTKLHDQQPNRRGRDQQAKEARRKKIVPPPHVQDEPKVEEAV